METIELDTKRVNDWIVIAYDPIDTKPSRKGGNIIVDPATKTCWQCKKANESYLVWFYDYATGDPVWPFLPNPPPDPVTTPPVPGVTSYLRVNSKDPIERVLNTSKAVKYYAMAEHRPAAEWLDPMIIVRPNNVVEPSHRATDSVMFGVTCAVLGAAAGALLMALTGW